VILVMKTTFLNVKRRLLSKGQDPVNFAGTSASFAELALHVNFIIAVIKEDISEKLGSFLNQVLRSSAWAVMIMHAKMPLQISPLIPISYRYHAIYPIVPVNLDPIRC
jgi:hypothetical protein